MNTYHNCQKTMVKREILNQEENDSEKQSIKMTVYLLSEILKVRRQQNNPFKILGGGAGNCQPKITYPVKILIKTESKIETF